MKRRDFFKGLLGLAILPFVPKVAEAKSIVVLPPVTETLMFPNHPVIPSYLRETFLSDKDRGFIMQKND